MENDIRGMRKWEARPIPTCDRGPIALKTLELLERSGSPLKLYQLDPLDLLALIVIEPDGEEELRGLIWLSRGSRQRDAGMVVFSWMDQILMEEWGEALPVVRDGIRDWAREFGRERVFYYSSSGYKKARDAARRLGFHPSPQREFVREIPPE